MGSDIQVDPDAQPCEPGTRPEWEGPAQDEWDIECGPVGNPAEPVGEPIDTEWDSSDESGFDDGGLWG